MFSLVAFADSGETQTISFTGQSSDRLSLNGIKTRTEYHTVPDTCYRSESYTVPVSHQVPVYTTRCRPQGYPPRNVCQRVISGYRYETRYITRYRQVPYSCSRTVSNEVFDYATRADISFEFHGNASQAQEQFQASIQGEKVSLSVQSSGRYLIAKSENQSRSYQNGTVVISTHYDIYFTDASSYREALAGGIKNLNLTSQEASFEIGDSQQIPVNVFVELSKKKSTLISRVLAPSEYNSNILGQTKLVVIDFDKLLGADLSKGKYDLKVRINAPYHGQGILMNESQLSFLNVSKELEKVKIK